MGRDSSKDPVRKLLIAQPKFVRELIAGGVAGGLAKTCVAPLERGKIMIQTGRLPGLGVTGILSHVWQTEGIAGMFRGNGASVLRIVPYAAIHFSAYENYRRLLVEHVMEPNSKTGSKVTVHPLWDLLAGSAAGATAVLLTYPLDLVRTRMAYITEAAPGKVAPGPAAAGGPRPLTHVGSLTTAAAPPSQHVAHPGIRQMLVQIAREDGGLVGLYRGVNPTLLGILPYAGLKFYVYQSLKAWYKAPERQQQGATTPANSSTGGQQRTLDVDVHKRLTMDRDAAAAATDCVLLAGTAAAAEEGLDIDTIEADAGGTDGGTDSGTDGGTVGGTGGSTDGGTAGGAAGGGDGGGSKGGGGHGRLPLPVMLGFGGVAGLIAQTVTYPLDVIRRRMQVGDQGSVRATTWSTTHAILTQEGWWGLMRGLSINYLKVVPSTAIGFTVYDQLKEYMDIRGNL